MKTLHLSVSLSRAAGGIFEIQLAVAKHLVALDVGVEIFGLVDDYWLNDSPRWESIRTRIFGTVGPRAFGYAPRLLGRMRESDAEIAHLHYMWMYPSVAISRWAAAVGRPYVVTPNGMLEPWALSNSAWKKKLAGMAYENRMLRGAACLQANTAKEMRDFRAYGLKNPVCVIPNGIDVPEIDAETLKTERLKSERKTLLFLGRLHPKKGLVDALRAWGEVKGQRAKIKGQVEWQFVITGWDQGGHEAELKLLCKELGLAFSHVPIAEFLESNQDPDHTLQTTVIFTGPAFGAEKDLLLRQASAFILPSFSEGLPMSVLEAWSYGLPVLMTDHCNLPEGFSANAAIRIGTEIRGQESGGRSQETGARGPAVPIEEGLRTLFELSDADRGTMGRQGRALVEQHFTWPQVAAQLKEVYEWLLGGGPKPGCVS